MEIRGLKPDVRWRIGGGLAMRKRRVYNPKRCMREKCDSGELARLVEVVSYGGNPEHKRNPGDFGLCAPVSPRPDKTLCDSVAIFDKEKAKELLKLGIIRGLISGQMRGPYCQNVWVVTEDGVPMEAQLENESRGIYHGYPLAAADPFRECVLNRWMAK
jgi:hypothetical protein